MRREQAMSILRYVKGFVDLKGVKTAASPDGFGYYPYNNDAKAPVIVIGTEKDEIDDVWEEFMVGYLKETFDLELTIEQMDLFSVLHEVGHHVNRECFDAELYNAQTAELDEYDFLAYRQSDDEYLADSFAVTFIKEHYEDLMNLI